MDEEGPLWTNIRQQFYRSEVPHVKRIVGEHRIRRNKTVWQELVSLRQILADFECQNDQFFSEHEMRAKLVDSPHRNLLERQARLLLQDLQRQCQASGRMDVEIFDNEADRVLLAYVLERSCPPASPERSPSRLSNCSTPSTRPSSSCFSRSSGVSEDVPCFATGEPLPPGELQAIAARISEALDEEHLSLLAAIEEQTVLLEAEAAHQSSAALRAKAEPSTAELQRFVHHLQELCASPGLQALAAAQKALAKESSSGTTPQPREGHSPGGAGAVRRLRCFIEKTRQEAAEELTVPELECKMMPAPTTSLVVSVPTSKFRMGAGGFDPFFDDPFQ